jgi:hypothetical protein
MVSVEATVSQVDLKERALATTEYKLGNVATTLFGDGIFRDPPTTPGLFGQIEQKCFGKIDIDKVRLRGVVDYDALKDAGVAIVRSLDPKDKARIIAASAVLKT